MNNAFTAWSQAIETESSLGELSIDLVITKGVEVHERMHCPITWHFHEFPNLIFPYSIHTMGLAWARSFSLGIVAVPAAIAFFLDVLLRG